MRVWRNLRLSATALGTHRIRSMLAVIGAAAGVGGLLILTAAATGARAAVVERIGSLGRNMLIVTAATIEARGGRAFAGDDRTRTLRREDAEAILAGTTTIRRVAAAQDAGRLARFGPIRTPVTVVATTPEWQLIRRWPTASGRFFTHEENVGRELVAVIGAAVRTSLFPDSVNPVGQLIRLDAVPVLVVGVLESKGVSVDGNATEDDRIYVPLETGLHRLFNREHLKMIYAEAADDAAMASAEREIGAILRARHDPQGRAPDDFQIQNQRVLLEAELATRAAFRRLTTGLGFLGLLVGGIGILSIMLLAVRERRREIGLRVALGARRADIGLQFLVEAVLLAMAGGLVGVGAGAALAGVVGSVTGWTTRVTAVPLAVAVGSTGLLGVVSGVWPAWRAAALDPIAALSSE